MRREFEDHGTKIRALNDRGDDSPEGELTDGILDQLAKFERAKTAERSRRGKLRKAREGKIVATTTPDYGFRYNATRDGYVVDEEAMLVVRRIFREVAVEGRSAHAVKARFDREGVRSPGGAGCWNKTFIRECILDDVYQPHTFEEIQALVAPEVAARLDPGCSYGVWWFNRRRQRHTQVSENGTGGRTYRRRTTTVIKPKEEWIAVPVPDSGIPREWVDAAREGVKDNRRSSNAGRRYWELSGGIMRCGACGHAMVSHTVAGKSGTTYFYYACRTRYRKGRDACAGPKNLPASKLEARVWRAISGLLKNPERLRAGLNEMIERERDGLRGDAAQEAKVWADKLAEVDHKRARYQEMSAEGLIDFDELRAKLAALEETRETARRELTVIDGRRKELAQLEHDRDSLIEHYASMVPGALDTLSPEERHRVYELLKLRVTPHEDERLEISGTFGESSALCETETAYPHL